MACALGIGAYGGGLTFWRCDDTSSRDVPEALLLIHYITLHECCNLLYIHEL